MQGRSRARIGPIAAQLNWRGRISNRKMLAEWLSTSRAVLNTALHGADGIIIAVVAVELMPEA